MRSLGQPKCCATVAERPCLRNKKQPDNAVPAAGGREVIGVVARVAVLSGVFDIIALSGLSRVRTDLAGGRKKRSGVRMVFVSKQSRRQVGRLLFSLMQISMPSAILAKPR